MKSINITDNFIYITTNDNEFWFNKLEIILFLILIISLIFLLIYIFKRSKKKNKMNLLHNRQKENIIFRFTYDEYAQYIIKQCSESEEAFFKNDGIIKYNFFTQTLYYIYTLYICEQILNLKYSISTSGKIIEKSLNLLLDYQAKSKGKENTSYKIDMLEYFNSLKQQKINLFTKHDGLLLLSKSFITDINNTQYDGVLSITLSGIFASFIKYKTEEIINPKIELIEIL